MASTINFSSAFIRTVGLVLGETKLVRLNITSSVTKEVREKMGWNEAPKPKGNGRTVDEAAGSIGFEDELSCLSMTIKPNDKELVRHAFTMDVSQALKFEQVTVHDGDSSRRELRFQVLTSAKGVLAKIEKYTDMVEQAKAEVRLSYTKQGEMFEEDGPTPDTQQKLAVEAEAD